MALAASRSPGWIAPPAGLAVKGRVAEVQLHAEQAVAYIHRRQLLHRANRAVGNSIVVQMELKIVAAVGGTATFEQAALVGESGAHSGRNGLWFRSFRLWAETTSANSVDTASNSSAKPNLNAM